MDCKKWLIDWFVENSDSTKEEITSHLDDSFFTQGFIDSFRFILLLAAIRDEYKIEFDNEIIQNHSFKTISGLAEAIEKEKNK